MSISRTKTKKITDNNLSVSASTTKTTCTKNKETKHLKSLWKVIRVVCVVVVAGIVDSIFRLTIKPLM